MTLSSRTIFAYIVIAYAVVLVPFVDTSLRNYLTISGAMLGGVSMLGFKSRGTGQFMSTVFLLSVMATSVLMTSTAQELLTVALTAVYATGYFAVSGILGRISDRRALTIRLLRNLVYAFAIVSLVQMIASLVNLPVPNVIGSKGMWSYPSLTMEPSHLGRVAGITMLAYLVLSYHDDSGIRTLVFFQKHRRVLLAFLTTMLLSGSTLAFLAMIVVLVIWRSISYALVSISVTFLAMLLLSYLDIEGLPNSFLFFKAFMSFDIDSLIAADPSGAVRVLPIILFVQDFSLWSPSFWIGGGVPALEQLVSGRIPGVPDDQIMLGFFPGYLVFFGMFATAFFVWTFAIYPLKRRNASLVTFWLIFFTTSAWNTQVFWYGLMMIQIVSIALEDTERRHAGVQH